MNHEIVCADCGINTDWANQYAVPNGCGDTKMVCEVCAKKYGYNLTDSEKQED